MGYDGKEDYPHYIQSRHSSNNTIDNKLIFCLNDKTKSMPFDGTRSQFRISANGTGYLHAIGGAWVEPNGSSGIVTKGYTDSIRTWRKNISTQAVGKGSHRTLGTFTLPSQFRGKAAMITVQYTIQIVESPVNVEYWSRMNGGATGYDGRTNMMNSVAYGWHTVSYSSPTTVPADGVIVLQLRVDGNITSAFLKNSTSSQGSSFISATLIQ